MKYLALLSGLFFIAARLQAEPDPFPETSDPAMQVIHGGILNANQINELKANLEKHPVN